KFRNILRPGITGMSQVKGFRGPAKTFDAIFKRYQWDAFYVRNANFWLDMRIIRKTAAQTILFAFRIIFSAKGARQLKKDGGPRYFQKALLDMRQRMNGLL
ncbi:MAG TPA: sugar transferase, partial [Agriterribacter sp.]|nr:sugar transferase [Agriterribacter sp.]